MPQSGKQRGLFITLEGIEGAGKSTQQDYIARLLTQRGHRVVQTREPGGTALGEAIRRILLAHAGNHAISHDTELLLMFAARCQHVDEIIRPNLKAGITVLSDRFTDSSFAYQGGGRGIAAGRIRSLQQWVPPDLNPDLTLLLVYASLLLTRSVILPNTWRRTAGLWPSTSGPRGMATMTKRAPSAWTASRRAPIARSKLASETRRSPTAPSTASAGAPAGSRRRAPGTSSPASCGVPPTARSN